MKPSAYPKDWPRRRLLVLQRDRHICWVCGRDGADSVDHVVRIVDGGMHDYINLRAAHLRCNIIRSSRLPRPRVRMKHAIIRARVSRWG
jgi:5-methylcytosine-specific restriction endonuclease McrA